MKIDDDVVNAIDILLDFAYGIDVEENHELCSFTVVEIAHCYTIRGLWSIACAAAMQVFSVSNCPRASEKLHYEEATFRFLLRNIQEGLEKSPCVEMIKQFAVSPLLSSEEVTATEFEKFKPTLAWTNLINENADAQCKAELWSCIRFELLNDSEMEEVTTNSKKIPKSVFVRHEANELDIVRFHSAGPCCE